MKFSNYKMVALATEDVTVKIAGKDFLPVPK